MERIAAGYILAEAPVADPDGGLWFSDVLGGGVHHWSPGSGQVETVVPKRRGVGGMVLHADGGLVMSGRDIVHVRDGETTTVYSDETAAGFNDLTVDPEGRIVLGVLRFRPFAGEDMVPGEFIRLEDESRTTTAIAGVEWVNGCAFSPDGRTLYGCDYRRGLVLAADVGEDGGFVAPRTVVTSPSGEADGMAVDEDGALWVALGGRASVGRFRPDSGELDLEVEVPAPFVASLCFGGADRRDLFITTTGNPEDPGAPGGVYLTRSDTPGLPIPLAR
jgi:sugar lactone lactonase YvrE